MEPTSTKELQKALAGRLARYEIKDKDIKKIAHRVAKNGLKIGHVDFCPYGICIDYFCERKISIDEFIEDEKFRVVKLFPYGILVDDLFRIQVQMQIPELSEHRVSG